MGVRVVRSARGVDWNGVAALLQESGLSELDGPTQRLVFERSRAVAFALDDAEVVGCARALSDGICQAAVYNVAVREPYQGRGIGRALIEAILDQVRGCTVVLYTHPRTVALYERFGFRRLKTGMAIMAGDEDHVRWMDETGFLLPEGYRFGDNEWERRRPLGGPGGDLTHD